MTERRSAGAAGKDEFFQWWKRFIQVVEYGFQLRSVICCNADVTRAGHAQFPSQVKELVLNMGEAGVDGLGQVFREQYPDVAVEFVHFTNGVNTQAVFGRTCAIAESGGAIIAGAGVDFGEAIAHLEVRKNIKLDSTAEAQRRREKI